MSSSNVVESVTVEDVSIPDAPVNHETTQSIIMNMVPLFLIFLVFYFLLIRPQEKKRKAHEQLVATVRVGEEVLLHSGIFGKITKIGKENDAFVEVTKGVEFRILLSSIADILSRKVVSDKK
jgi:preprotein translocase subunit YajC